MNYDTFDTILSAFLSKSLQEFQTLSSCDFSWINLDEETHWPQSRYDWVPCIKPCYRCCEVLAIIYYLLILVSCYSSQFCCASLSHNFEKLVQSLVTLVVLTDTTALAVLAQIYDKVVAHIIQLLDSSLKVCVGQVRYWNLRVWIRLKVDPNQLIYSGSVLSNPNQVLILKQVFYHYCCALNMVLW